MMRVDELLRSSGRAAKQLQQVKTSLMQRMFPREGTSEPELRLDGFSGSWSLRYLGEFDIKTGPFGSMLHAEDYVASGTPIVTTEHFKSGALPSSKAGLPQVGDADATRLANYALSRGDIVFSRVGSVDLNAVVEAENVGWFFSGRVLRVRADKSVDSAYLHSALETAEVRESILTRAVGLTMASINTTILRDTKFPCPESLDEQRAIGSLFSNFHDLILAEQTYVQKLQQVKTALMQKMFI